MTNASDRSERHNIHRIGWLRAVVLGANDGIVSTSSLVVGIAAAGASHSTILMTGAAALVAGAMAMAAGEYVSVQSQSDTEKADLAAERSELLRNPAAELRELKAIYIARGLDAGLAQQVAEQLTTHDALGTHARDELGIMPALRARPVQAAFSSAASFAVGAALPLLVAVLAPQALLILWLSLMSLGFLALLGAIAAHIGGSSALVGAWRVTFWGALAMAITAGAGVMFDAAI